MMPPLYLVQHGQAKSKADDPARPLTDLGRQETERIAELIARLDLGIREIRHSGKTRAEETAVIFGRALDLSGKVTAVDGINPTDDVEPVAEGLKDEEWPVMLVGHLPFMPRLAGFLVEGDAEEAPVAFRYSGVVCLDHEGDSWRVNWQLNPG